MKKNLYEPYLTITSNPDLFHPALRYSWQALLRIYIASPDLNENGHESQLGNLVLLGPNFKNGQYTTDIQTGLTIFLYKIGNILLDGTHSMNVLPKKFIMASSTLIRVFTYISIRDEFAYSCPHFIQVNWGLFKYSITFFGIIFYPHTSHLVTPCNAYTYPP